MKLSYFVTVVGIVLFVAIIGANGQDENLAEEKCSKICKNGVCTINNKGKPVCTCPSEYGLYSDTECRKCDCGKESNCTYTSFVVAKLKSCVCKTGYEEKGLLSKACKATCNKNPCKNGGTCKVKGDDLQCECKEPFFGKLCENKDLCKPNPCQNDGTCNATNGQVTCKCKDPYAGKNCTENLCNPNPCQNRGTCNATNGQVTCKCQDPYTGKNCTENLCNPNPCHNDGTCSATNGQVTCKCQDPYAGKNCTENLCEPNPCQNGGMCNATNGDFTCKCQDPYTGTNCTQQKCECKNGLCKENDEGKYVCTCPPEWGLFFKTKCEKCECGKESNCTFDPGFFSDGKICLCKVGYEEKNEVCKATCNKNPCQNGGKCKLKGDDLECECSEQFFGELCEKEVLETSTMSITTNGTTLVSTPTDTDTTTEVNTATVSVSTETDTTTEGNTATESVSTETDTTTEVNTATVSMSTETDTTTEVNTATVSVSTETDTTTEANTATESVATETYSTTEANTATVSTETDTTTEVNTVTVSVSAETDTTTEESTATESVSTEIDTTTEANTATESVSTEKDTTTEANTATQSDTTVSDNTTLSTTDTTLSENQTDTVSGETTTQITTVEIRTDNVTVSGTTDEWETSTANHSSSITTVEEKNTTLPFNFTTQSTTISENGTESVSTVNVTEEITTTESNFTTQSTTISENGTESVSTVNATEEVTTTESNFTTQSTTISENGTESGSTVNATVEITTDGRVGSCEQNPCKNGGTCEENKYSVNCLCAYPYGGKFCTESYWCTKGLGKVLCGKAQCDFDFETRIGRCRCQKGEYYDYNKRKCQAVDKCPLTPEKCKGANEICEENECRCSKNFKRNEKKECAPNFCESNRNLCQNSTCEENPSDPENVKCVCQENEVFNGDQCIEVNKCDVPPFLSCQQICNATTETCDCYQEFTLQKDGKTCQAETAEIKCSKNCTPGICYKHGDVETCICPFTHVYQNGTCKVADLCKSSNATSLCPENACESHPTLGFRCKCEGRLTYDENNVTCRKKVMCSEGGGLEICSNKSAKCVEDPYSKDGFRCECAPSDETDTDGVCKSKCEIKYNQDQCLRKGGVCEIEDSKVICKCPPMFTLSEDGWCEELARASYMGTIPFAKDRYSTRTLFAPGKATLDLDYDKMRHDFRDSMHLLFGSNYKFADILSCSDSTANLNCTVEVQFETEPKDQVKLIGDSDTCINYEDETCFIPPALVLSKKDMPQVLLAQTDPCTDRLKLQNCGGQETVCNRLAGDGNNFQCTCSEGFASYGTTYPVADRRTVIHKCQDINECLMPQACPNTTECKNSYGSYECPCLKGYGLSKPENDPKVSGCVELCGMISCGKGKCEIQGAYYRCKCDEGYTGENCEKEVLTAGYPKGMEAALIVLSTIVIPLALFSLYMVHKYRIMGKKLRSTGYLDDGTASLTMEPLTGEPSS